MQQSINFYKGIRKRSSTIVFGMPLWDIALGPDSEKGEIRGYARGFIAIGDIAKGFLALGGVASGAIAIGGLSLGVVSFGGLSLGLFALGGILLIGAERF